MRFRQHYQGLFSRHRVFSALFLAVATLSACDADVPVSAVSKNLEQVQDLQSQITAMGEFDAARRFQAAASVRGSLRPGDDVQIDVIVRANLETKGAQIRVFAPEVALHRQGRFGASGPITGVAVQPEALFSADLAANEERTFNTTLRVSTPGYYRILLEVTTLGGAPNTERGQTVLNTSYDEVWFTVDNLGGAVTRTFDATAVPVDVMQRAGPYLSLQSAGSKTESGAEVSLLSDPLTLQMSYNDRDTKALQALADARYRLVLSTGTTYSGQTNASGELTFPCASPGTTGMLDVWYESAGKVSVIRHATVGTLAFHGYVPVTLCGNYVAGSVDQSLAGDFAARVFANALLTINTSRSLFPARASIEYKMSTKANDTYYDQVTDRIQIDTLRVWGTDGVFVAAHEYGHAVHAKALGGYDTSSGTCPSPHEFTGYYNYGCAYYEGFANYHSAVVRGPAGYRYAEISGGVYHGGLDGALNEGGVAAFLFDLTDPAGASYPTSYVADVYRTCDAHHATFGWGRASGIDHMVYCFERAVDPAAHSFFRGGATLFDGQRESATEPPSWSQTTIRSLWKANLFNQ